MTREEVLVKLKEVAKSKGKTLKELTLGDIPDWTVGDLKKVKFKDFKHG